MMTRFRDRGRGDFAEFTVPVAWPDMVIPKWLRDQAPAAHPFHWPAAPEAARRNLVLTGMPQLPDWCFYDAWTQAAGESDDGYYGRLLAMRDSWANDIAQNGQLLILNIPPVRAVDGCILTAEYTAAWRKYIPLPTDPDDYCDACRPRLGWALQFCPARPEGFVGNGGLWGPCLCRTLFDRGKR